MTNLCLQTLRALILGDISLTTPMVRISFSGYHEAVDADKASSWAEFPKKARE